ncbi:MAG: N-acetyltransferase [Rhodospirillaceae bacterium]|jgi:predicted N-acetyltransferase YhbS|nr:N-acetyltransferase [Rhodospirillaceae bacterium]MBT5243314.1 N-acetyltransferase [Rhodospirillaceae bacterium]MBT5563902.1 N-acetyltransferase [Rhodospirillaceae bacterium]MBT6240894.1 N-acetyltransferase [Rhodospirillaceae bacterium]MBT7137361.1 N-acetyltransferase [Rhodospirillaceae bacterium]
MFLILPERPDDEAAIEPLLDDAFGAGRHDKASYAFRQDGPAVAGLSFVARCGNRLVGSIRFWPLLVGDTPIASLLLGPLGVAPEMRNYGIGRGLVCRGHMMASALGYKLVFLVGEEKYYSRFGYNPAQPHGLTMPGEDPARLMVHELEDAALKGVSGPLQSGGCLRSGHLNAQLTSQASL